MELKEIYSTIVSHMIKGMMIHAQLADYYDFLGGADVWQRKDY